jgi:hypothetical protein
MKLKIHMKPLPDTISRQRMANTNFNFKDFPQSYKLINGNLTNREYIPLQDLAPQPFKYAKRIDHSHVYKDQPIIILECKEWNADLAPEKSDLPLSFTLMSAKYAILTNGILFRFFTDSVKANHMDEVPFYEFRIDEKQLNKANVSPGKNYWNYFKIQSGQTDTKYKTRLQVLSAKKRNDAGYAYTQMLIRAIAAALESARIIEQLKSIVSNSFNEYIADSLNKRARTGPQYNVPSKQKTARRYKHVEEPSILL